MSFERIAGPRKGKAIANKTAMETSGTVKGSNPGGANKGIAPVGHKFTSKGGKQTRNNVVGRDKTGTNKFKHPKDPG